jgi:hypothetical protein
VQRANHQACHLPATCDAVILKYSVVTFNLQTN